MNRKIFDAYSKSIKDRKDDDSSIVWNKIISNRNNDDLESKLKNFRNNDFAKGIDNN